MWFKRETKNRRLGRKQVLNVKLRSGKLRAARTRLAAVALGVAFGTVFGLYILWRAGGWALDQFVYENPDFDVRHLDVQTDGVISPDQIRRWSGVQMGENIFALDLAHVRRELKLVPMIQTVSVERILPATLRIRVTERQPVAQVDVLRPRPGGGIDVDVFQLDAQGYVLVPLDPRQRAMPLDQANDQLPVISGGINVADLQPGRQIDSPPVQAALGWITAFGSSPMAGLVDLKSVDISAPDVLVVTTGQDSQITFSMDHFDQQLLRWEKVHEECARLNKVIATLDLAVTDSIPLRLVEAGSLPPSIHKKSKTTPHYRKRNV